MIAYSGDVYFWPTLNKAQTSAYDSEIAKFENATAKLRGTLKTSVRSSNAAFQSLAEQRVPATAVVAIYPWPAASCGQQTYPKWLGSSQASHVATWWHEIKETLSKGAKEHKKSCLSSKPPKAVSTCCNIGPIPWLLDASTVSFWTFVSLFSPGAAIDLPLQIIICIKISGKNSQLNPRPSCKHFSCFLQALTKCRQHKSRLVVIAVANRNR